MDSSYEQSGSGNKNSSENDEFISKVAELVGQKLNPLLNARPGVNFINIQAHIFLTKFWRKSRNITRKAAKKDVFTIKRAKNVDQIDVSCDNLVKF